MSSDPLRGSDVEIRAATASDADRCAQTTLDVLPDHWRAGGNRRSFVAVHAGRVVRHVRGIDNRFHPGSRVLVLQVHPGYRNQGIGSALCSAQIAVSRLPLRLKVYASMKAQRALARRFGGVVVQATPPWRYAMTHQLRRWAEMHRGVVDVPRSCDRDNWLP